MAILATGNSFSAGDQVSAAVLNAAINSATFAAGAVDDSTIQLSGGALQIKDGGVTSTKLSTGGPTWTTGGKLTVTSDLVSSGNVGVGITSPTEQLHVRKDGTDVVFALFESDLGANTRDFKIKTPTSDSLTEPFRFTTNNSFSFEIDSAEIVRIDDTGKVGVGETAPSALLHVTGGSGTLPAISADTHLIIEGTDGNAEVSILADSTSGNSILNFGDEADEDVGNISYVHSTNRMVLNVGAASASLELRSGGSMVWSEGNIRISNPSVPASASASGSAGEIAWDSDYIYMCVSDSTWKRVGISTW